MSRQEEVRSMVEGLAERVISLGEVSYATAQHPVTVAQLREKHELALQLFAGEQNIKMDSWRIEKYAGHVYGDPSAIVPTPDMLNRYRANASANISILLAQEFKVEPAYEMVR